MSFFSPMNRYEGQKSQSLFVWSINHSKLSHHSSLVGLILTRVQVFIYLLHRICQKDNMVPSKHYITQTFISKHSAEEAVFTDDAPSYHLWIWIQLLVYQLISN